MIGFLKRIVRRMYCFHPCPWIVASGGWCPTCGAYRKAGTWYLADQAQGVGVRPAIRDRE